MGTYWDEHHASVGQRTVFPKVCLPFAIRQQHNNSVCFLAEYEEFDDVYGHSVEDDNCISPSDGKKYKQAVLGRTCLLSFHHKGQLTGLLMWVPSLTRG
jgi:hypothetical protein